MTLPPSYPAADVLIIGAGLIGLSCAAAAAERGFNVVVVGQARIGQSSQAAAGMLAPSIERAAGTADVFGMAARDRYPSYLEWLYERTGIRVPLNRDGIIQLAVSEAGVRGLRRGMSSDARWLEAAELHDLEPGLKHGLGGVFHANDGAVDNLILHEALLSCVRGDRRVAVVDDAIVDIAVPNEVVATGQHGSTYRADRAIIAAGVWSAMIRGLPRALPVEPVRGQMISYEGLPLSRCVYGPTGYVVPRASGRTLVGATSEYVGFDSVTTSEGVAKLKRTAAEIVPAFATVEPADAWAGLRPMSADLHPILGTDPDDPRIIYATGHSRNGVLMTPITGDCIAALLAGEPLPVDIDEFSIARFASAATN